MPLQESDWDVSDNISTTSHDAVLEMGSEWRWAVQFRATDTFPVYHNTPAFGGIKKLGRRFQTAAKTMCRPTLVWMFSIWAVKL